MGWEYKEATYTTGSVSTDCRRCDTLYEGDADFGEGVACWKCPKCNHDNETETGE